MKDSELIRNISFFAELSEDDLEKIAAISIERRYRKGMIIFMEGEPGDAFYYLKSGKVKVFRTYENGKEHIINIFGEGEVFGEVTLFNSIPYPASAAVYEDAVIGVIKSDELEKLVTGNPGLALRLIKVLTRRLLLSQQKIRDLAFNDVFARTASQLLKLAGDYGQKTDRGVEIDIQLSRQELAEMVGTTRETISRVISRFKKEKAITEEKDKVIILNKDKLEKWI